MKRFYIPAIIILLTAFIGLGIYSYLEKVKVVELPHASVATSTIEIDNGLPQGYEMWRTVARKITKPEDAPKYDLGKDTGVISNYGIETVDKYSIKLSPCAHILVLEGDAIMDLLQKEAIDAAYQTPYPQFRQNDLKVGINFESFDSKILESIKQPNTSLVIQRVENPTPDNFCTRWKVLGTTSQPIIEHRSAAGILFDDFGFMQPFKEADLYAYYGRNVINIQDPEMNINVDCEAVLVNAEDSPVGGGGFFSPDYKRYVDFEGHNLSTETLSAIRASTKEKPVKLHIAKTDPKLFLGKKTACDAGGYTIELAT